MQAKIKYKKKAVQNKIKQRKMWKPGSEYAREGDLKNLSLGTPILHKKSPILISFWISLTQQIRNFFSAM